MQFGYAQLPNNFYTHIWKVEKYSTVFGIHSHSIYHKDSTSNKLDYTRLQYSFFGNSTYTLTSDSSSSQGTWAVNAAGDSVTLDSVSYLITELTPIRFTARQAFLYFSDTTGTIDTGYAYVSLYPLSATPLPVELISFSGNYEDQKVRLNWTAANQQKTKEFEVQYSTDGIEYTSIGNIPTKEGRNANYVFYSTKYQSGKNYYRLKQVDLGGYATISKTIMIRYNPSDQSYISIYPNPTSNQLILSFSKPIDSQLRLTLNSMNGQKIWSALLDASSSKIEVTLPAIPKGIYRLFNQ
jgi:hypothetical protein